LKGLAILFGFQWAGTFIHQVSGIPLPGNVIGLALFTAALFARLVKLEWVEESAQFLLKHMMLFYVPVIVGTIAFVPFIINNGVPIMLSLIFSTLVTVLVTGWVTQLGADASKEKLNHTRGISEEMQKEEPHEYRSMGG
jgi:holin-like protein